MRRHYIVGIIILGMLGIVASILINPTRKEVALMKMEDKYFETAFAEYKALYESGDGSVSVVMPLSKLYLQYGDVESAIKLLEQFIQEHPESVTARKQLGVFYQYAQRPDDYVRNLEELHKRDKSAETLRELSDIYNFNAEYAKQIDVLEELIYENEKEAQEKDYVDLAYMYGTTERFDKAFEVLDLLLNESNQQKLSIDTIELSVILMLDAGRHDRALETAKKYVAEDVDAKNATRLAARMHLKGFPQLAVELLAPFKHLIADDKELFTEVISLELSNNNDKAVFAQLSERYKEGNLPDSLLETFVELSVDNGTPELLKQLVKDVDLEIMNEEVLLAYAEVSILNEDKDFARSIADNLGSEFLQYNTLVKAALDLALGDEDAEDRMRNIAKKRNLSLRQTVSLINIYNEAGLDQYAYELLQDMSIVRALFTFDIGDIIGMFIRVGKSDEAARKIEEALVNVEDSNVIRRLQHAKLLIYAGAGNVQQVTQWIRQQKEGPNARIPEQDFLDIYFIANQFEQPKVALIAMSELYQLEGVSEEKQKEYQFYYADALLDSGKFIEALNLLTPLVTDDAEDNIKRSFIAAASGLVKRDGKGAAKPYLEKLSKVADSMFERDDITLEERRGLAFILLDAQFKEKAVDMFMKIARISPKAQDMDQLMYLWGNNPEPAGVKWLKERALEKKGEEKSKILYYLNNTGNAKESIDVIKQSKGQRSGEVTDAYLDALLREKDKNGFKRVIKEEVETETEPKRLRKMGEYALGEGMLPEAKHAYGVAVKHNPNDLEALKNLAMISFFRGEYSEAESLFVRYHEKSEGDYLSHFYHGEIELRKREYSSARNHYDIAEALIEKLKKRDISSDVVDAYLLFRKNRLEDSLALFRQLLRKYPQSDDVKTSFANVLIEMGKFDEAERVLLGS